MDINRRNFVKNTVLIGTGLATTASYGFHFIKQLHLEDEIIGHGDYQYKVCRDWAQISRAHTSLLNCHEMQMDSKGRLLMLGDHTKNNMLVFDKSGKLLDAWGTRYPGGHGLTLNNEGGEDVLFIVDCGWWQDRNKKWHKQAGVVHKTTIDGNLIFSLPDPHTIGVYNKDQIYMPTETAIGPNGDIYVADGYGSDYILQYSENGEFIRKWGGHSNEDENYNLLNAHGVTIDYRDKNNPVLICTSRTENCFKFFTLDGKFIKTVYLPGAMICRAVIDDDNIYTGVCWSETRDGKKWIKNTGFTTILDANNKVVSNPGGEKPVYKNGQLQKMYQSDKPVFAHGHDVLCDEDKNLYVCQWNAQGTPPIKLVRV
ncbi:hypothetical protein JoomaDRAFT_3813 [Galbibacter orientalis DSM 19592]|uniref:NHL repeat protein n=1 Tax=Galbibacter orientalis DSM 19592 TaxID=926559 RepID=I3CAV0_9FLAO|nr:peptidylglycine monooxygenase [Galbibacter orientalis]EIJ40743.1 hypothetical protein JoomaDRAFT_3813 [Galbibacter orientalis DSM 19592]